MCEVVVMSGVYCFAEEVAHEAENLSMLFRKSTLRSRDQKLQRPKAGQYVDAKTVESSALHVTILLQPLLHCSGIIRKDGVAKV